MSNEPLGIVEEARRRRQIYGRFMGRPDRALDKADKPPIIVTGPPAPKDDIAALRATVTALTSLLTQRERELADALDQIMPDRKRIKIADVMAKFVKVARAEGCMVGARPYAPADLLAPRRSQSTSTPRHVCMDLAHRITGVSTTLIGRAFGGLDHTSVLHGLRRTPEHIAISPLLAIVHAKVLAAFEDPQ